jgi:anaerobic glycerol-3-phosphate dehydrogenase
MAKGFVRAATLVIACIGAIRVVSADTRHAPLRQTELLALVAGKALPENIAAEINADGLAFHPDDAYRSFLRDAGADAMVLKAVDSAKVNLPAGSEDRANPDVLRHISAAAKLMDAKKYQDAASELTAAVTESFKSPECGFVMGGLCSSRRIGIARN